MAHCVSRVLHGNDKGASVTASNVKTMFLERKTSTKAITWKNKCSVVQMGGSYTRIEYMSKLSLSLPEGLNWYVHKMSQYFHQDYVITDHSAGDIPDRSDLLPAHTCPSLNILNAF